MVGEDELMSIGFWTGLLHVAWIALVATLLFSIVRFVIVQAHGRKWPDDVWPNVDDNGCKPTDKGVNDAD